MSHKSEPRRPAAEVERWIAEVRAGSQAALDRLLSLCQSYLLATARKEIGAVLRVRVCPSDLVQHTLCEAWLDFPCFQGRTEKDWLAWLRQILRHNLENEIRRHVLTAKRSIYREVPLAEVASAALPYISRNGGVSPCGRGQFQEKGEVLERSLQQLPAHYRQALVLHTCDGLTFAQVGERLHCSAEAARKLWGRGAEELRKLLGDAP